MIRKIMAIAAASACAAAIVTFMPDFSSQFSAQASQPADQSSSIFAVAASMPAEKAVRIPADIRNIDPAAKTTCTKSWPYYERSCMRDDRQLDGNARVVRVIAIDRSAAKPLRR